MLILDNFGSTIIISFLNKLDIYVKKSNHLTSEAKHDILETTKVLKNVLPFLERCHRALFYCGGAFYELSKRFTSVHYVRPLYYSVLIFISVDQ